MYSSIVAPPGIAGQLPLRSLRAGSIALVLLAIASGCARQVAGPDSASLAPSVTVVKPRRQNLQYRIEQPGTIEAFERAPLYARLSGYVQKVDADIGKPVRKGDLLAELSVPEMEKELKQKQALVEQAKAEVVQSKQATVVAKARVVEWEAGRGRVCADEERWHGEYKRVDELVKQMTLTEQSRNESWRQWKTAEAALAEAEAKVASAKAERDKALADEIVTEKRLHVAEADCERTEALLKYKYVVAPFDGVVTQRAIDPGHLVQPGRSGTSGKAEPLFVVMRTDTVRVFVDVPAADAVFVKEGLPARIRGPALGGEEFPGAVARSSWALESEGRTLRTEIDLSNPSGKLRPGTYVRASLEVERPAVWTLPAAAIVRRDGQDFCCCLENGKAVQMNLRIGAKGGVLVEVQKKQQTSPKLGEWENFNGSEAVIVTSPGTLTSGQAVTLSPESKE